MILGLVAAAGGGLEQRLRRELAEPAVARGWDLAITFTPTAGHWMAEAGETARLQALTPLPVRSHPRLPSEPKPYRVPDAFLFVPATANSLAKLALGIQDNQALTALAEAVGTPGLPVVIRPQANLAQRAHPMFTPHLDTLRAAGCVVVEDEPTVPWGEMLDLLG
ncbi:flavoprotein [Actinokineospora terrae]|uniref:Flavoprotein n=1 Tax=Actinokineospora terrae TaxID=155974 RepID=A0A1H9PZ52_9PSEU|nr:flavoprotein [Actinokineospora terrae]SER53576.1 Flavoprotein [Actinokineospora terrae]